MKLPTVPVLIDDHKDTDSIKLTRCNYFSIECDAPSPNWMLGLPPRGIPFLLTGLSGIITRPIDATDFRSPILIEQLFDAIESDPSFFVDINQIWIPNFLFHGPVNRGTAYRLDFDLFTIALSFQNQLISYQEFLDTAPRFRDRFIYSEVETNAFMDWEKRIITQAIESYPKNLELALKYRQLPAEERQ